MKERFGLYLILTDPVAGYETCAKAAVDCGVHYLQLRMKNTHRDFVLNTAYALRKITHETNTRFIINDDLAIAREVDADGIHLGQDDLPITEARASWNKSGKLFGLSTHNAGQADRAEELKPDYIGIGPVYPTQTKTDIAPVLGPLETGRIAQRIPLTSVAIGGINTANLSPLLDAGVYNFCVVNAVNEDDNPARAINELSKIWHQFVF